MSTRPLVFILAIVFLFANTGHAVETERAEPIRVACLGDSITAGKNVAELERYPAKLQSLLGGGYEVQNFGLGSATLLKAGKPNVWQKLDAAIAFEPHIVTIVLGTNDTVSGTRLNWEKIAEFEADYAALIARLAELPTKPRILICTPTDMVLTTSGMSEGRANDLTLRRPRVLELCERIRVLAAAQQQKGVEVVELNRLFTGKPELVKAGDGAHPNADGYAALAGVLANAIRPRPNVLLFLVDDLGWQDTSVPFWSTPTPLNERYKTPNLERLADRGMLFTNAYASAPVCTPTRCAIMTGKSPARTNITYWTLNKDVDTSRKRDDIAAPTWQLNGLQPGEHEVLPQLLQDAGYQTIHVGKAHFGTHESPGADPTELGFIVNIAGHASGGPASYYGLQHFTVSGRNGKPPHESSSVWDIPGLDKYHGHDIYLTEALALEAGQAIRDSVAAGKPFYMNFAPYAVHAPIMGNKKYESNYPELDAKERAYASMIETYDAALGALITTLEETGQLDNTVIIFSSDNGGLSAHARGAAPDGETQHTHNAPLRSGKGSSYEGGTRAPTIIAWPGVTDAAADLGAEGMRSSNMDTPIISHDFFPTILSLAGISTDFGATIDGRDLTPLLAGRPQYFDADRTLGWNQPHQWGASGPGIWPFTSIRYGNWKLIYAHADRSFELFDLGKDIGEENNLAQELPAKVGELAGRMDVWILKTGAQLSIDRETGNEIESPGVAASAWSAIFSAK